jgi:hypothetical protein
MPPDGWAYGEAKNDRPESQGSECGPAMPVDEDQQVWALRDAQGTEHPENQILMQKIDEQFLATPCSGSRKTDPVPEKAGVLREPQAYPASDGDHGASGDLSGSPNQPEPQGAPDLPLPSERSCH